MYNRYIPQSDGSYSRKIIQKPQPNAPAPSEPPKTEQQPPARTENPPPVGSFLRNLLPKEFDTGDLLIVLLLLLMAGEKEEEKSNALLTLALYFFM